ncbi:MAG: mannan endo,4-beta-mannosidase, partial [Chloroflexota bacterium]|nr:mannan endo,4-beta-mannosidase [Chloroflexota bacterium]
TCPPTNVGGQVAPPYIRPCGRQLCAAGLPWHLYGASEYQSTSPAQTGVDNVAGTVALAREAKLNTLRVINFYDSKKSPTTEPYNEARWAKVDAMVAAAGNAGMRVVLGLADYRNILWNNCINPYTADWGQFIAYVAARRNTVTGRTYGADPTIALVSLAGEPLQVGTYNYAAKATGADCTITYGTQDLTDFYTRTLAQWKAVGQVSVNTGGLGYLNFNSGIDWRTIFALPNNDVCDIKTYGGMLDYAPTVASYCAGINKPWIDEEFGWQQSDGDAARAAAFRHTLDVVRPAGCAGEAFWNMGNQEAATSYDIGRPTPLTLAAVQEGAV